MKAKKNNVALTRTSAFREDRKNYLTEDGYTYWRWDEDLKKEVPVHIGLGEEYTDPDALEREAGEGDVMIVSIWNRKGTIFEGYHTFAVQKVNGELMVYNRFNNSAESTEKKTMGEVIENGQFIVGYRVQNAK